MDHVFPVLCQSLAAVPSECPFNGWYIMVYCDDILFILQVCARHFFLRFTMNWAEINNENGVWYVRSPSYCHGWCYMHYFHWHVCQSCIQWPQRTVSITPHVVVIRRREARGYVGSNVVRTECWLGTSTGARAPGLMNDCFATHLRPGSTSSVVNSSMNPPTGIAALALCCDGRHITTICNCLEMSLWPAGNILLLHQSLYEVSGSP